MKTKITFLTAALMLLTFLAAPMGMKGQTRSEGDELAICQGTGSGYGTRRTLTDSHNVGWVLASGQTGYLGANSSTNHDKVKPTTADLPVVKAVKSDATTSTTGYYFYYTTTAVANVGSLEFSYTGNSGNSSATAYVVVGDAVSAANGEAYEIIQLSSESTTAQNASLGTSGTFTYEFNETQSSARYYGFIIVTTSFKRLTAGTIKLKEGAAVTPTVPYTVTLADDNTTLTESSAGAGVTLPSRPDVSPYSFAGWSETNLTQETVTATVIPTGTYHPTQDVTLYPVYSRSESGATTWTMVTSSGVAGHPSGITEGVYAILTASYNAFNGTISGGHGQSTTDAFVFENNVATSAPTGTCEITMVPVMSGETILGYKMYNADYGYLYAKAASAGNLAWHDSEDSYWHYTSYDWIYNSNSAHLRVYQTTFRTYGNASNAQIKVARKDTGATTYYISVIPSSSLTVTYNANGADAGNVPEDDNEYDADDVVTVLGNTGNLAKSGYNWSGWCMNAEGTGTVYGPSYTTTFTISDNTTLYAKWTAKTITGLSYTGTPTTTSYYAGANFDPTGLTVTATFNDNSSEDVTSQVVWTPSPLTVGTTSVTGTYMGMQITVNGLTVTAAPGSQDNPYTVAQARDAIDAGTGTQGVYVTGIISNVESYSSQYHSITYWISSDGTTTSDQLEVYSGKGLNNTDFSSIDDVEEGATVIVYGNLKKYNDTYEFDYNNYLVSYTAPVVTTHSLTFSASPAAGGTLTVGNNLTSPADVAEGATINISAEANTGYVFGGWTVSTGATVADATSASTTFTMGTTNATLTATFTQVNTYTVTYHANLQNVADIEDEYSAGEDVTVRGASTFTYEGHTITKWTANADGTGDEYALGSTIPDIDDDYDLWAYWEEVSEMSDCLDYAFTGISGTSYSDWSGKTGTSGAVYAGNSGGQYSSIQLRTDNNNSGIVTTASGGKVTKVAVTWNSNTTNGRTLNVYGKTTAYTDATDLYSSSNQGTLLGTIVYGTNTELSISGDYNFIGVRSANKALYLDGICITWSTAPVPAITVSPDAIEAPYTQTNGTLGLTLSHMTITDAGQYEIIWCDDQGNEVDSQDRPDWIDGNAFEASISGGAHSIAYTIPANNTNSERATHFMVYGLDDDGVTEAYSNVVTITQAAAPQPAITLSSYEIEATAAETNGSLDITLENMSINSYEDFEYTFYTDNTGTTALDSKPDWIAIEFPEPTASQYTLSYSINENESSNPRTAYFTVKAPEAAGGHKAVIESEIVTVSQAGVVTAGTWVLTTLAQLTPADVFVIVGTLDNTDYYALPNDLTGSNAPTVTSVTISGNNLSNEPSSNLQWNIHGNATDGYTFYPVGSAVNWLFCNTTSGSGNNNNMRVGTTLSRNSFVLDGDNHLMTNDNYADRYLSIYVNSGTPQDWRGYLNTNSAPEISFYKKVSDPVSYTKTIYNYTDNYNQSNTNGDYYLIASPVASVTPTAGNEGNGFLDNEYDLYAFDQTAVGEEWRNYKQGAFNLVSGKGYLYANSGDVTLTFEGQPYLGNGIVDIEYSDGANFAGWNLIGNPFPTAATFNGEMDFYKINPDNGRNELIVQTGDRTVEAMEGVFVLGNATTTTVTFTKVANSNPVNPNQINIEVLQAVTNTRGTSNQLVDRAIVRFDNGSTLPKFMLNADNTKLYIPQDGKDYAIVDANNRGEMPVNFKASKNGEYTLSVEAQNLQVNYLHLIDNKTGMDVDLLKSPTYTFEATVSDYESRFRLVFNANDVNETVNENETFAFISNGQIILNGVADNATVQVIDMLGRVIVCRDAMHGISTTAMTPGVYVLRVINGNNVKTQKIVVE